MKTSPATMARGLLSVDDPSKEICKHQFRLLFETDPLLLTGFCLGSRVGRLHNPRGLVKSPMMAVLNIDDTLDCFNGSA